MQACVGIYACTYTSFSVFRVQIDLESFVLGFSARSDDLLCNLCGGGGAYPLHRLFQHLFKIYFYLFRSLPK